MRIYGIAIDADTVITNPHDTSKKGYTGWWSCSAIDIKVTLPHIRLSYLEAISDAVIDAQKFSKETNIAFISEGGAV